MEDKHMEQMAKLSSMMSEACSMMDEMKSMVDEMTGGESMEEGEYMKSSPEKRESYDKMKMMSRGR